MTQQPPMTQRRRPAPCALVAIWPMAGSIWSGRVRFGWSLIYRCSIGDARRRQLLLLIVVWGQMRGARGPSCVV
jgi:hypothetical protein